MERQSAELAQRLDDFVDDAIARGVSLRELRREIVSQLERRYVVKLLALHGGCVAHAAATSGLADRYFRALKARYTARARG